MVQMAMTPACNTTNIPMGLASVISSSRSNSILEMVALQMAGASNVDPYPKRVKFNRKEEMAPPTKGTQADCIRVVDRQVSSVPTSLFRSSAGVGLP